MTDQVALAARAEELSEVERWGAAAAAWQAVVDVNPTAGAHWARLAEARHALGDHAAALAALRQAEELGVWGPGAVHVETSLPGELRYRTARCHAALGDTARALEALAAAVGQGLRDVGRAATDPDLAALRGEPRFRALVDPPDVTTMSRVDGWRADLDVLRRTIERRVPFREVLDGAFDAAYDELVRAVPELPDTRVVVGMWALLRRLGDGHARLDTAAAFPAWESCLPVWFYLFAEGLFVPQVEPAYRELLGARVLAFDGRPVDRVIEALDPVLTRDNRYGPLASIPGWLRRPVFLHAVDTADDPTRVTLTVRRLDGTVGDVTVPADAGSRPGFWPHSRTPSALLHHVLRRPGLRVYVVIGRHTFSAAQNTATLLGRHTDAVFVGEPSGSSPNFVGETAPFRLPYSGIRANVSDVYWQTSWPFDRRVAIPPDVYTPATFAAYHATRDPALEAILRLRTP